MQEVVAVTTSMRISRIRSTESAPRKPVRSGSLSAKACTKGRSVSSSALSSLVRFPNAKQSPLALCGRLRPALDSLELLVLADDSVAALEVDVCAVVGDLERANDHVFADGRRQHHILVDCIARRRAELSTRSASVSVFFLVPLVLIEVPER